MSFSVDPEVSVARIAGRLLPGGTLILLRALPGAGPLRWTERGWEEPGVELSRALRALCRAVLDAAEPIAVSGAFELAQSMGGRLCLPAEVAAFAGVPLRNEAGVLGVAFAEERVWAEDEIAMLADLAALLGAGEGDRREPCAAPEVDGAEPRYQRMLMQCPSAILVLSEDGRLLELNHAAAEILGCPPDELVGRRFDALAEAEGGEAAREAVAAVAGGRQPEGELELYLRRPTGERRLVHVRCAPVRERGSISAVQGVMRDITEERARELQHRRADRMASVAPLLSGVCHELNNPLTSIKSFAELMLLDDRPDEDREALEIMQREAHRAARIVTELRLVARQSQEAGAGRGPVQLNDVVRGVLRSRSGSLSESGVEVRMELPNHLPPAWASRTHLEQVVGQLVGNAEQAMQEQAGPRTLIVRTCRGELGVSLVVSDTGPGVSPENLERIFDPFWTTKTQGEGRGLGLSLVHSIVSDHGGRVRVDSLAGQGSTFTVDLPVAGEPAVPLEPSASTAASQGLRILVVDDEAPIRFSLVRYMERRGHHVDEACEGGAALQKLQCPEGKVVYDIIVADLRMPGLDGEQLFKRLRERGDGLEQRLIFMTGDAESPDAERVLRDAGVPVVWKPFELAELAQIIEAQARMTTA